MTSLGEWLKKLIGTTVILGFLELILPEGEMHRFARVVLGLLVLFVMLQPLAALIHQSPNFDQILTEWAPTSQAAASDETAANAARVSAAGLEALERARRTALERAISESVVNSSVSVTVDQSGEPHVLVRLRDGRDPSQMRQTIASQYGLPAAAVEVRVDE